MGDVCHARRLFHDRRALASAGDAVPLTRPGRPAKLRPVAIQQPRWVRLAILALVAAVPRAAHGQSAQRGWTAPVYGPPPAPANPPADAPTVTPAPSSPGYAPGYGPPAYAPAPAYLPPAYPPPPPEHGGFFLRLHFGPGFDSFSSSGGTSGSTQLSGAGMSFGVALGGAVAPNLAVFGNFFESGALQLSSLKTSRTDLIGADNAAMGGLGAGVVHYVQPLNLYISGALALSFFFIEDAKGKTLAQTGGGIGFEGMIGKEWWASQHWGAGAAIEIIGASGMKDKNDPTVHWTTEAFNFVLSASYF